MKKCKKPKLTFKEELEGWLVFDGYWFWRPRSGFFGSVVMTIVFIAILLAWGMWICT